MKNIQTVMMIIFGVFIIFGVMAFAGILPTPGKNSASEIKGKVALWGTLPKNTVQTFIQQKVSQKYNQLYVKYTEFSEASFEDALIEALAAGAAPDMIILPDNLMVRFEKQLVPFSYTVYPERQFKDTFLSAGNIFLKDEKVYALPLWTDPMVMYWNKDMFASDGISKPPLYWDEFLTLAPIITKRSDKNDILKSAISFGEFRNVTNAKEILATLLLQTGNPIIQYSSGKYTSLFSGRDEFKIPPAETSFRFFTDFANPLKPIYSWSRSLPESKSAFLSGDLAVYFGFASEVENIMAKNPNLNFDVAVMPQVRTAPYKATYARVGGIAILRTTRQPMQSSFVARFVTSPEVLKELSPVLKTPPTNTGLLAIRQKNSFMQTFYSSAIIGKTWIDLDSKRTSDIFQTIVDSVISGQATSRDAVSRAEKELADLADSKNP